MTCACGHPAHHHTGGCCVTVTITGPPSEDHGLRTERFCDCTEYRVGVCECGCTPDDHHMTTNHCLGCRHCPKYQADQ